MRTPVHVTVTGAAGNVGYALVFRAAAGALLGPQTPIVLRLLDIEPALPALEGVAMELADGAYPLLHDIVVTADPATAFERTSWALLVGATPRKKGMERGDLLSANAAGFGPQGAAIMHGAASDVRILVVGNPCNTNCLIAREHAPEVPDERWFAMTRLDENRAKAMLARRAHAPVADVTNMAIWGNHSPTQFPDARHARIGGRPAPQVIEDHDWLDETFITDVQTRGAAVIEARKQSSAGSAAQAIIDSVTAIRTPTAPGDWSSLGVVSHGEYGVPEGLVFSYPVAGDGGRCAVVEGITHDDRARERLRRTTEELLQERDLARNL